MRSLLRPPGLLQGSSDAICAEWIVSAPQDPPSTDQSRHWTRIRFSLTPRSKVKRLGICACPERRLGVTHVDRGPRLLLADANVHLLRCNRQRGVRTSRFARLAHRRRHTLIYGKYVVNLTTSVETTGLEPATSCLQSRCSSQLSYVPEEVVRSDSFALTLHDTQPRDQLVACWRSSPNSIHSRTEAWVDARTTGGAAPASNASFQRDAHRHQRSPATRPGKPRRVWACSGRCRWPVRTPRTHRSSARTPRGGRCRRPRCCSIRRDRSRSAGRRYRVAGLHPGR
jgi:hypothetical protein